MTLLTLAAVALFVSRPSIAPGDTQPTAVVTARSAEFFIPVAHDGLWRWYRTTTPDNDLEYCWQIGVSSRGVEYELGFYLFKFPRSAEGVGDLAQLLKAGQGSLWRRHPADGGSVVTGAEYLRFYATAASWFGCQTLRRFGCCSRTVPPR
jgi:hypothetical protein